MGKKREDEFRSLRQRAHLTGWPSGFSHNKVAVMQRCDLSSDRATVVPRLGSRLNRGERVKEESSICDGESYFHRQRFFVYVLFFKKDFRELTM